MTQFPDIKANATGPHPSRRSLVGLDWFTFFLADVQTGFGPFVAVYLTTAQWTQQDIGFYPVDHRNYRTDRPNTGGAIVDAARSERNIAAIAVVCIGISALMLAAWPLFPLVFLSTVLSSSANCVLAPAIGAISLGLVGHFAIGPRLGRNGALCLAWHCHRGSGHGYRRTLLLKPIRLRHHGTSSRPDPDRTLADSPHGS